MIKSSKSQAGNRLPALFIGHGNPMHAVGNNKFTRTLTSLGKRLERPKAILCISAHWMTSGTWVTHMAQPKTIHDFYGFPQRLFDVQYPAPGSPSLAEQIQKIINTPRILLDDTAWGLDHGAWSILVHMYPEADIPVVQMSLDLSRSPEYHFNIGRQLKPLRDEGVLIVGSGNIVHNLEQIDFSDNAPPLDWALEFDAWVKNKLEQRDFHALLNQATEITAGRLSIPSVDHWYPLFYTLGAQSADDELRFEFEGLEHGSLSMRSFGFY